MKKYLIIAFIVSLSLFSQRAGAQVQPRVAGLEGDTAYMALLAEEHQLRTREDSLGKIVSAIREKLRAEPANRVEYSQRILALESDIFDVRNRIGKIAGRVSVIEQEFILSNLNSGNGVHEIDSDKKMEDRGVAFLTDNAYFREHLPAEDYKALRQAEKMEPVVAEQVEQYRAGYARMAWLADEYMVVDSAALADSLWSELRMTEHKNDSLSALISKACDYISDNKIYCYTLLLDLTNNTQALARLSEHSAQARDAQAQLAGARSSAISSYSIRKRLVFDYEKAMANALGLTAALDSLTRAEARLASLDTDFPAIEVEERLFIDYEEITIHSPALYNAANPIPELRLYDKGTIYRILLGTFQQRQAVSVFRGASPLGYLHTDDNRYAYYTGGFDSQEKAEAALAQMKKVGFRAPKIAMWSDGEYSLPDEEQLIRNRKPEIGTTLYRVDISGAEGDLNEAVKAAIRKAASGKDIIKLGDKFTVGTFDSDAEARGTADAVLAADSSLKAVVAEVATAQ